MRAGAGERDHPHEREPAERPQHAPVPRDAGAGCAAGASRRSASHSRRPRGSTRPSTTSTPRAQPRAARARRAISAGEADASIRFRWSRASAQRRLEERRVGHRPQDRALDRVGRRLRQRREREAHGRGLRVAGSAANVPGAMRQASGQRRRRTPARPAAPPRRCRRRTARRPPPSAARRPRPAPAAAASGTGKPRRRARAPGERAAAAARTARKPSAAPVTPKRGTSGERADGRRQHAHAGQLRQRVRAAGRDQRVQQHRVHEERDERPGASTRSGAAASRVAGAEQRRDAGRQRARGPPPGHRQQRDRGGRARAHEARRPAAPRA